jgi:Fe2+ or Zn2+ uptake regulation protein
MRLDATPARTACLQLVSLADSGDFDEDELLEAWTDMIAAVATVYRAAA